MNLNFLNRYLRGLSSAANKYEGRNMPMVAAITPDAPICNQEMLPIKKTEPFLAGVVETERRLNWSTDLLFKTYKQFFFCLFRD